MCFVCGGVLEVVLGTEEAGVADRCLDSRPVVIGGLACVDFVWLYDLSKS